MNPSTAEETSYRPRPSKRHRPSLQHENSPNICRSQTKVETTFVAQNHHHHRIKSNKSTTTTKKGGGVVLGSCVSVSRYVKIGTTLGRGTYGVVYKAKDTLAPTTTTTTTGYGSDIVALKRCLPHHQETDGFPITALREISILRQCSECPYIVSLLNVAVSRQSVCLVLEYCEHDLAVLLDDHYNRYQTSPFREEAVKTLLRHLLCALHFLHSRHMFHRDIKMSNLLYTHQGILKVADFGLARHESGVTATTSILGSYTPQVASLWYRAPEVLLLHGTYYTNALDVWAAGCVWAELLHGRPLLPAKTEMEQIQQIHEQIGIPEHYPGRKKITIPASTNNPEDDFMESFLDSLPPIRRKFRVLTEQFGFLSDAGCQLFTSLLQVEPEYRWTAGQALRSPYLTTESPQSIPEHQMPRFPTRNSTEPDRFELTTKASKKR